MTAIAHPMRRVLVIGCGGSGKSHFAIALGLATGIPVIHLDRLYWKPGWRETPKEEWTNIVEQAAAADRWIMDGNYGGTMAFRLGRADTVIFLDLSRHRCLLRVAKRRLFAIRQTRVDMAEGCPERWDWEFTKWIWNFKKKTRPRIMQTLQEHGRGKNIHVVNSAAGARTLLHNMTRRVP